MARKSVARRRGIQPQRTQIVTARVGLNPNRRHQQFFSDEFARARKEGLSNRQALERAADQFRLPEEPLPETLRPEPLPLEFRIPLPEKP